MPGAGRLRRRRDHRRRLQSGTQAITGSGFLQRLGDDRMAMVHRSASSTASAVLLTSGRRQPSRDGEIRMQPDLAEGAAERPSRSPSWRTRSAPVQRTPTATAFADDVDYCPTVANAIAARQRRRRRRRCVRRLRRHAAGDTPCSPAAAPSRQTLPVRGPDATTRVGEPARLRAVRRARAQGPAPAQRTLEQVRDPPAAPGRRPLRLRPPRPGAGLDRPRRSVRSSRASTARPTGWRCSGRPARPGASKYSKQYIAAAPRITP